MVTRYCANCGRRTGHKRAVGIGAIFMFIITLGFWIFLIPFYPKRCTVCGLTKNKANQKEPENIFQSAGTYLWIFIILLGVVWIFGK